MHRPVPSAYRGDIIVKKVLLGLAGLLVLLVVAALVVPGFIDWNAYKAEIAAQAKAATGRDVTIGGDIRMTVLPAPALLARDVRMANLAGASEADMVRLKSLEIRIALWPLLGGEVQVQTVKLVEPVIHLEVLADGRRNWDFASRAKPAAPKGATESAGGPGLGGAVRLDSFIIENGTVTFRDAVTGVVERVEKINASIAAASLAGPFESTGTLTARGIPLQYDVSLGRIINQRTLPIGLTLGVGPERATVKAKGTIIGLGDKPKFKGTVVAESANLAVAIRALARGAALPGVLARAFSFEADVVASAAGAEVTKMTIRLGETRFTGALKVATGETVIVDAKLAAAKLDLDEWLAAINGGAGRQAAAAPVANKGKGDKAAVAPPFEIPRGFGGSLEVTVDALTYRGGVVRQIRVGGGLAAGRITLKRLSALLPGGSDVTVSGVLTAAKSKPRFEGNVKAATGDLRGVLRWLGVAVPDIPADRLRRLSVTTKVVATPDEIRISGLAAKFDSSRMSGGVTVALRERPAFGASIVLDRLNVDAYLPPPPKADKANKAAKAAKGGGKETTLDAALDALGVLDTFDANIKARVGSLVYGGTPIEGIVFDGTLHNGTLTLRRASADKAAGASVSATGSISGFTGDLKMKGLNFEAKAANTARLFRMLRLDPPVDPKALGAVTVKGKLDGTLAKPTFDVALSAAGAKVKLSGTIGILAGEAKDLRFDFKAADTDRLFRAFNVKPTVDTKRLGAVAVTGRADGSLKKAVIEVRAQAAGAEVRLAGTIGDLLGEVTVTGLSLDATAADAARLFPVLRLKPPIDAKGLGTVTVKGRADGSLKKAVIDVRAQAAGADVRLAGTIGDLLGEVTATGLSLDATAADAARLFRVLRLKPPIDAKGLGAVTVKGRADGSLKKATVDMDIQAAGAAIKAQGTLSVLGPAFRGTVKAAHGDLAGFVRAMGSDYRFRGRVGGFDIAATVDGAPDGVTLRGITGTVGDVSLKGDVEVVLAGVRPHVTAALATGAIVVDNFLPATKAASLGPPMERRFGRPGIVPAAWMARPIEKGLPGLTLALSGRWSVAPLDLSVLRAFDADVALNTPALSYDRYRVENAEVSATIRDGVLTTKRLTGAIFGGTVQGSGRVNAQAVPRIEARVRLQNLDVARASRAISGKGASGRMGMTITLAAQGASVARLISSLGGDGAFEIRGLDVKAGTSGTALAGPLNLIAGLGQLGAGTSISKRADITGSFRIARGIVRSNDLRILSEMGTGQAKGVVDLPNWQMDVKGSMQLSQGLHTVLASKVREIPRSVPIHIKGPVDNPKILEPNVASILTRTIVVPGVQKLIDKKLGKSPLGGLLKGILGGQPQPAPAPPPQPAPGGLLPPPPPQQQQQQAPRQIRPEDLLRQLFKR